MTDLVTLGQRLRHQRKSKGMTLEQLSEAVGRAPSQLSLIENGKREPRLSLLEAIAGALGVPLQDLLRPEAPSRRAGLEIDLAHFQQSPAYAALGLPPVKGGRRLPADALESLVGLHRELNRLLTEQSVREAWGHGVLSYADVSLEVLLMADPERARAFVRAELGELGAEDEVAARLRETVEASHRYGSHVTTAAHLHLHEHTVRNRLQKAAELLGRPLTERRTELQVALRLARLLIA